MYVPTSYSRTCRYPFYNLLKNILERSISGNIGNKFAAIITISVVLCSWHWSAASSENSTKHWVGSWAAAPYKAESNLPPTGLSNNTLRQIVRVSIGGDTVRLQFSNITCSNPVTMKKVNIAVALDSSKSAIDPATITALTFDGKEEVTISAKSDVYSDPVAFNLKPGSRLAISINYGQCQSSSDMTFHYGSRTPSYILSGDQTDAETFNNATSMERWFTIYTVEVLAPKTAAAVAAIGNSITDGTCLGGGQMKWTDWFSAALLKNEATKEVSVLNLGIGATLVTRASNGAVPGVDRFEHDVLKQSGVKWIIIFYGINDVNGGVAANSILDGIKKMCTQAHAKDTSIKVYGATMTPIMGHSSYGTPNNDAVRKQFNELLRSQDFLDGVIDFEKAIQDPNNSSKMKADLQCDYLHPNEAGYRTLGESIDLKMFTPPPVKIAESKTTSNEISDGSPVKMTNNNSAIIIDLPEDAFVSCKVYSLQGKKITELAGKTLSRGRYTLTTKNGNLAKGIYLYRLTSTNTALNRKGFISLP